MLFDEVEFRISSLKLFGFFRIRFQFQIQSKAILKISGNIVDINVIDDNYSYINVIDDNT